MRRSVVIAVAMTFSLPSLGARPVADVIEQLKIREAGIQTVQFTFHQDIQFHQMESQSTVDGTAYFKSPGFVRVEKSSPTLQITVSDGKRKSIYTPAYKQVWKGVEDSWMEFGSVPQGLFPFTSLAKTLENDFNLVLASNPPQGRIKIAATPKDPGGNFNLIIEIEAATGLPVRSEFRSESATIVTVLSDVQENIPLGMDLFKLDLPKDVEVITVR